MANIEQGRDLDNNYVNTNISSLLGIVYDKVLWPLFIPLYAAQSPAIQTDQQTVMH